MNPQPSIRTPDQRLRVFVSSTLHELAEERRAAKSAIQRLRLAPVMFELGARPHPPRELYRAYLEQSHIFIGIYWQRYGWVAPGEAVSGLEDEYRLSSDKPKLIYVKRGEPEERLKALLATIQSDDRVSYKPFEAAEELRELIENDLALLLTERFASLRREATATATRTPLPTPPTPLIGRDQELAEVSALLQAPEVRLVTLLGPGGIGKTRLALAVASQLEAAFEGGAVFVSLAAIRDPALVVSALAQALDVTESGGQPLLAALEAVLRDRPRLLVLDNFEQVMSAAPRVAGLLGSCPGLKALVTSRERLHLSAEYLFLVPPLGLPKGRAAAGDAAGPAVELFVQRARAVNPRFALTPENAAAVAEICRCLDGLPLAIELAAARVKHLSPQAMLERLHKRFDLLKGGARDLPSRQQTLENTIRWSYDLLSSEDKNLFERLAVFAGGWTLEAAEAVAADEVETLGALGALLDKSLLYQEDSQELRFGMLQSVRPFAWTRLEASGRTKEVESRHAAFFLALAEEAEAHLRGAEQGAWLEGLEREHDNLRAVLSWAARNGEAELGLRLAGALWRFWWVRGHLSEGRAWLAPLTSGAAPTAAAAKALQGAGVLAHAQGDAAEAGALFEASLHASREVGDRGGASQALNSLAILAYDGGDYARARSLHEESLGLRRQLGDKRGVAHSLLNLGNVFSDQGELAAARALYEESLALSRELKDQGHLVTTLLNLSNLAYDESDYARARAHLEESLTLSRALGDAGSVAHALGSLGNVFAAEGDYARARSLYEESLAIRRELGDKPGVAHALLNLGLVAFDLRDMAAARSLFEESLRLVHALGNPWRIIYLLEAFAALRVAEGAPEAAATLFGAAEAGRQCIGVPLPPSERARYERNLAAARERLDEASFAAAWAEGRAWDLDGAVTFALAEATA